MADNAGKYLAVVDVREIQDYIFKSPRFRVVRGASLLLRKANEEKTARLATGGDVIYSTGGRTEVLFSGKEEAEFFCRQTEKLYRDSCPGVEVSWAVGPCDPAEYRGAMALVEAQLAAKKYGQGTEIRAVPMTATPFTLPCQDCGEAPAVQQAKHTLDEERLVCSACAGKRDAAKPLSSWPPVPAMASDLPALQETIRQALGNGIEFRLAESIEEIAEYGRGGSYVALIACDGDGIGAKKQERPSPEEVHSFSKAVVAASTKALNEAVAKRLPEWQQRQSRRQAHKTLVIPLLVLLHGGDDLLLMTAGSDGLALAADFCRAFARESAGFALTASAGVAIAHPHHPLRALNTLAHELLQSAKRKPKRPADRGCLDFHVVQTPSERPLEVVRQAFNRDETTKEGDKRYMLTCRPYALASEGDDGLQALLEATQKMGPRRTGFPRGVLHDLPSVLSKGSGDALREYRRRRARLGGSNQGLLDQAAGVAAKAWPGFRMEDAAPWAVNESGTEYRSALLDLEEIIALEPSA